MIVFEKRQKVQKRSKNHNFDFSQCHDFSCEIIINGKVDINWTEKFSISDYGETRSLRTRNCTASRMRLIKCDCNFWIRARTLTNLFNDYHIQRRHRIRSISQNKTSCSKQTFSEKATTKMIHAPGDYYVAAAHAKKRENATSETFN